MVYSLRRLPREARRLVSATVPGQDQDPDEVLAFLRKIGSKSDKARAKKDDTETFDWNLLD
jgi:hypothetical protein